MRRRMITSAGAAGMALALLLTACGGDEKAADGPVTLTMSAWSLDTTPEFKTLADSFHAANPDITVELKEYDPDNYDTQLTADLSAGNAPDVYVLKNLKNFVT
jgi:multiple sugar transport system substrate-binding protein